MFFKRKDKLYEDDEPLQEQIELGDIEAQDEFPFEDSNDHLFKKLKELNEENRWKGATPVKITGQKHDFLQICP